MALCESSQKPSYSSIKDPSNKQTMTTTKNFTAKAANSQADVSVKNLLSKNCRFAEALRNQAIHQTCKMQTSTFVK
jgi:hypothetical protein